MVLIRFTSVAVRLNPRLKFPCVVQALQRDDRSRWTTEPIIVCTGQSERALHSLQIIVLHVEGHCKSTWGQVARLTT